MNDLIQSPDEKTITYQYIRKVVGPLDDDLVAAIQETGASRDDIRKAYACFDDEDVLFMLDRPMSHRMRRVYDILQDDLDRHQRQGWLC